MRVLAEADRGETKAKRMRRPCRQAAKDRNKTRCAPRTPSRFLREGKPSAKKKPRRSGALAGTNIRSSGRFARRLASRHATLDRVPHRLDFAGRRAVRIDLGDASAVTRRFLIVDAAEDERGDQAAHGFERGRAFFDARGLLGRRALVEHEDIFGAAFFSRSRASTRSPKDRKYSGATE